MHGYWEAEFKRKYWVFPISFTVSLYSLQQVLNPIHQIIFVALLTVHSGERLFAVEPLNYQLLFCKIYKKCWVHTWYYFRGHHLFMWLILPIRVVAHCNHDCTMELWGWFLASDNLKVFVPKSNLQWWPILGKKEERICCTSSAFFTPYTILSISSGLFGIFPHEHLRLILEDENKLWVLSAGFIFVKIHLHPICLVQLPKPTSFSSSTHGSYCCSFLFFFWGVCMGACVCVYVVCFLSSPPSLFKR